MTEVIPLDLEAQVVDEARSHLDDLRGALGSVASGVLRAGGDQNAPFGQNTSGALKVSVADHWKPRTNGNLDLGVSGAAWRSLFLTDGVRSGAIAAELIVSGALASGQIGSGQIGTDHILDTSITSRKIAQNAIGPGHLASGAITSADIADQSIFSSMIASGQIGTAHLTEASVISSIIASGVVGRSLVASGGIGSGHLAGASVLSGAVGSGQMGDLHTLLRNEGPLRGRTISGDAQAMARVASGGQTDLEAALGEVRLGAMEDIGVRDIRHPDPSAGEAIRVWDELAFLKRPTFGVPIVSAGIASGQIGLDHLAVPRLRQQYEAGEVVSGFVGVKFTASGVFGFARASDPDRMPAFGVAGGSLAAGSVGPIAYVGEITNAGWNFSGSVGARLYLGMSGELTTTSPSASGAVVQRIGQVRSPDTILIAPDPFTAQIGQ